MKRLAAPTLALVALAALSACADQGTAPLAPPAASLSETGGGTRHIIAFNGSKSAETLAAEAAAAGGTVDWYHQGAGIAVVSGLSDAAARALPGAAIAAADAEVQLVPASEAEVSEVAMDGATGSEAGALSQANPTTAFFYPRQWHLRAIFANTAWAAGRLGSPAVRVAILDTGIDYTYPDLNGLVDLSRSANFVASDVPFVNANFPGKNPVTDLHFHGTHVAATVSSKAQVSAGVTSRVTLMAVKVLSRTGSGATSGVLQGVLYAADQDADVINMSLGSEFGRSHDGAFIGLVNRVFNYAQRQGSLVVVSAGNDNEDLSHNGNTMNLYCDQANVVCVSATGPTASGGVNGPFVGVDTRAPYSNYGAAISVAAPGGAQRPVWSACSQTSLAVPVCRTGNFTLGLNGTSQAAPHVSGLAALLVETVGKDRPSQLKHAILKSADDLGKNGSDPIYGSGRINVQTALGL
jgi:lantibiotic leader peptide-processing serine protease